ncbi:DUF4365 domain-containing protein [Vibrio neptunius]|uniref:DUF4365 domain-containing protein n=1 Tax=Vibrio neptunius TaxID=170651 RepID=UPI0019D2F4F3|nr:DUF4365 domain-containing protein [Vibrio neptunius]MBN3571550.1 DUF4365 domain-containing protein [Vibrio neptunius]
MSTLPKDGRSQEIGRLAGRALGNKLPKAWIEKELDGDSDFGIDYFVQLKSSDDYVSFSFYLQLKGTTVPTYSNDKNYISYDFKVETLKFYHQQEPLVMVAVVDLKDNEDTLWLCPIYYFWLDEDWFDKNHEKLESQKTISVKIPTCQILDSQLDVYEFYSDRIAEKFAFSALKKGIKSLNKPVSEGIETITDALNDKPTLLRSLEEKHDAPWLHNPDGEVASELKRCSDAISSNNLQVAYGILVKLEERLTKFSNNEKAEFYYQKAGLYSLEGQADDAEKNYLQAYQVDNKTRYQLGYIESKFKQSVLPTNQELISIIEDLDNSSYQKCIIKAKCLALLERQDEALALLQKYYPEKITGKMIIYTISGMSSELDSVINDSTQYKFENDREKYLFNSICARRCFHKATEKAVLIEETLPMQGKTSYNLDLMKKAYEFSNSAWDLARNIGYPSDIVILLDISILIYGYFDKLNEIKEHIELFVKTRPHNPDIIRPYSRLLFNLHQFKRCIELIGNLKKLDADDCGILILSNYYLGQKTRALELIDEHEEILSSSNSHNIPIIFCIGGEIAENTFNRKLSEKYNSKVRSYPDGEALIAVRKFVNSCNSEPNLVSQFTDELYNTYIELEKPITIAEQLFRHLDSSEVRSANRAIELGKQLLESRELTKNDYLHLAQSFLTTNDWESAYSLAQKNMRKNIEVQQWKLILAASINHQGKVGEAYQLIDSAFKDCSDSKESKIFYINLCLKLGLTNKITKITQDLYANSLNKVEKMHYLQILISVFSNSDQYNSELDQAIKQYGEIVDRSSCEEEGQYLLYCLTNQNKELDDKEVALFQSRLSEYTASFPDSPILRQGVVDLNGSPDSLIKSLHDLVGIDEEKITLWEKNKNSIRNGSLPVPFSMRGSFLRDTNDIFTTWAISMNCSNEELEYRIRHAPQLHNEKFVKELEISSLFLEETSLLFLNELKILDILLEEVENFNLIDSVFENITQSSHKLIGAPFTETPINILKSIHKHINKLVVFKAENNNPIVAYSNASISSRSLIISEDLYLYNFVKSQNSDANFGNIYNIINYLYERKRININEKYELISKSCELGLFEPNMNIELLSESAIYHLDVTGGVDYKDTRFDPIFDKIFELGRESNLCFKLLFNLLAMMEEVKIIHPNTILNLFKGLIIRHPVKSLDSTISLWFILRCLSQEAGSSNFIFRSEKHYQLWKDYQELLILSNPKINTIDEFIEPITNELFKCEGKVREKAYNLICSCFTPMTDEYEKFSSVYNEILISRSVS